MRHFLYIFFIVCSAQSIGQTNSELSSKELYKKAIIENDIKSQKELSKPLKSNYSTNTLNYYRTLLKDLPSHSILVTNGVDDTYPIKILQTTESIGINIEVVSLELLAEDKYINRVFDKLNVSKDFDKTSPSIYLSRILTANKKIFISSTVNPNHYSGTSNNCYVIGLALEYKAQSQLSKLEMFWADLQKKNKYKFSLSTNEKGIHSNYLPPLLTLYKLKLENGVKDKNLKLGILYLGQLLNKATIVQSIIEQYEKGG